MGNLRNVTANWVIFSSLLFKKELTWGYLYIYDEMKVLDHIPHGLELGKT